MTDYIEGLCKIGGEVYVVGGATRDYLYNHFHGTKKKIKDIDYIVRLLNIETLVETLKKYGSIKEVGKAFGVILFTPYTEEDTIEIVLPRTEISTGSGYRDFIVTPDHNLSLIDDFSRRDATINAIGYRVYNKGDLELFDIKSMSEPDFGRFLDPYNGVDDIKHKIWKCVGDPSKRFVEDPNRIMRAFRQSAELNLTIEEHTLESIKVNYEFINTLIPESYVRLFNELLGVVKSDSATFYLNLMKDLNILNFLGIENANIMSINNDASLITKFAVLISPEKMKENMKHIMLLESLFDNFL
jgi:tRNA nucleotidyltransferase (CCA-adding enzyme)